jgi:predicted 3-demethylubiquinone-9 3-methyltransferase (glyoxalase superfamily)
MSNSRYIRPCLWFDHQAEEAAKFYVSIFKNSKITPRCIHVMLTWSTS